MHVNWYFCFIYIKLWIRGGEGFERAVDPEVVEEDWNKML
jgi:hypothetical protein